MTDYIFKDWNAARLVESVCEPTLTGVPEWRRKCYEDLLSQYAMRLCNYMIVEEEKRNKKDLEL